MSDDGPVDASIRPVLPSRKGAVPQFDLAAQVEQLGADSLLPDYPKTPSNVVHTPRKRSARQIVKPDPKRSKRATAAWETRRKNLKKSSVLKHGGRLTPELYALIGALLKLDAGTRKMVMKIVEAVS